MCKFSEQELNEMEKEFITRTNKTPSHYKVANKLETINWIEIILEYENLNPYESFLLGNLLKYRLRFLKKEGQEESDKIKMMNFEEILERRFNES